MMHAPDTVGWDFASATNADLQYSGGESDLES